MGPSLSPSLYFLLCLSSFYLFLPPFLKNIDAQWHNHAALPFSNISCPPLFLWMCLNWYKNPHTYNSLHRKTAFSPPDFIQHTQRHFVQETFSSGLLNHTDSIQPKTETNVSLNFLSCGWVCGFLDTFTSSVSPISIALCGKSLLRQRVEMLSVSDSLTCHCLNHMTRYLDCSRPLIPKKWFFHSDSNTMI